jgi:hypothetical protein
VISAHSYRVACDALWACANGDSSSGWNSDALLQVHKDLRAVLASTPVDGTAAPASIDPATPPPPSFLLGWMLAMSKQLDEAARTMAHATPESGDPDDAKALAAFGADCRMWAKIGRDCVAAARKESP